MTIEGWVIVAGLFIVILVGFFTRLHLAMQHREERKEEGNATRQVVSSLTDAILQAQHTTNMFQVDQVGSLQTGGNPTNQGNNQHAGQSKDGKFQQGNQNAQVDPAT